MRKQYITFECQHQKISRTDDFYVVGGSQKYLYAKFSFCEDWEGERQYAVFTGGGNTYRVEIVNGECEVPWEVLLTKRFFVGCEAGQRITSNAAEVVVHPCGAPEETDTPRKPTPTLQSQIGELEELDTEHKENLVSAINELDDKLEAKASWGQNDPTKPDHIKDRTHWVENGALTPLPVAGKWVDDNNDGVNDTFYFSAPVGLEVGKTYTVNWNGTSYEVVCQDIATIEGVTISGLFLGNPAVAGISEASTDEPFLVVEFSSEDATQMKSFGLIGGLDKAEVPFAIYINGEVVHKLDNKFLDLDWLPKVKGNTLIKEQTVHCVQSGDLIIGEVTLDKAFGFPVGSKVPLIAVINGAVFKAFGTSDLDANTINVADTFGFGGVSRWWWFSPPVAGTYTVAVYESNENTIPDEFLPERLQSENVVPRSGGNFLGSLTTRDVYVGGAKDAYGNWSPRGARIVDHTPLDVSIKNEMYISTMQIREAGEYFLILPEGSNYLYGMQIGEADRTRHFDVSQMPEIPAGTYPDYYPYQVGQDIYVNFSSKTRVDLSEKAFGDGYQFQKRLNFQSKTYYVDDDTDRPYPAVQFTVSGPAVVRIWWIAGGDARYFAIQSKEGSGASRLEVSGTLNVHGRQYMNGNTLDMGGGDIVYVQSITTQGSAYIGNEVTVRNSLEVGSELQVGGRLTMTNGSTFDANGGDVKGVKSLRMNGTLEVDNDSKLRSIKPLKKWDDTGTEQEVYNIGTDESYYDRGCFNRLRVGEPVRDNTGKIVGHEYSELDYPTVKTLTKGAQQVNYHLKDDKTMVLNSSTEGSNKIFKIVVDDTGALKAVEWTAPVIMPGKYEAKRWCAPHNGHEMRTASITKVTVLCSYTPTGEEDDYWDISRDQDGSVMCYITGTEVIIAGNDCPYIACENTQAMFEWFTTLPTVDLSNLDTSNVTDMTYMFDNCSNLTSLDLSNFDTSKVTNFYRMFYHCSKLTSLDLSSFDTSNATDMAYMFYNCRNLKVLDISSFDTSKVAGSSQMFYNCGSACGGTTIYVKDEAMAAWVKATPGFPANATVIVKA